MRSFWLASLILSAATGNILADFFVSPFGHDGHFGNKSKPFASLERARTASRELKTLDRYDGPPGGPEITGDAFRGVPPEGNVVAHNVCIGKWLEAGWHAKPELLRLENNRTNATTSLASLINDNSTAKDFGLKKTSAAWSPGIRRIPVEMIGLRDDTLRRELRRLDRAIEVR